MFFRFVKRFRVIFLLVGVAAVTYLIVGRENVKSIPVKRVNTTPKLVEKTVSAAGKVVAKTQADLAFGTIGKINEVYVKNGAVVSKGTLIAQLDIAALLNSAQASKDARDVALRDRELFIEKYLYNKQAAGGKDEYDINLRRLDELLSEAESSYQVKRAALLDAYLYAPFDGMIYDIDLEKGESIISTQIVAKIADISALQFETDIDQEDFGSLRIGQKAYVELDSYPNTRFNAEVIDIPTFVDGVSGSQFTIKLVLEPSSEVKPVLGMNGDVHIVVGTSTEPVPAVLYDQVYYDEANKPYLWVVENGLTDIYHVELGLEGDVYYEVKTPLDGKTVVSGLNDDVTVKDGYKARIAK